MEIPPTQSPRPDWTHHWSGLRHDATTPTAAPFGQGRLALVRYGLAQPFLGLRTIARSQDMVGLTLAPAAVVMIIAVFAGVSAASEHGAVRGLVAWWVAIAALAPVPPLILNRLYAHLAAKARPLLGLFPREPYHRSLVQLTGELISQLLVISVGVLPYTLLARLVPGIGDALALVLTGAWTLHWIVVEGYDNARTLPAGHTVKELEEVSLRRPGHPWFHRWYETLVGPKWLLLLLALPRMLSEVITSLARSWRVEVDLVEERPWISMGFGLGVVVMLAVPGLNLLFRPAVVVGGVHLRHRLLDETAHEPIAATSGTQPNPVVPVVSGPGPS